ncbi:MAG: peptidoglycan-binding protein [Hyphomonadaceae bacterium]|nr:peptidoglycan-binding protein [Hyphomonadaceae bacterium]
MKYALIAAAALLGLILPAAAQSPADPASQTQFHIINADVVEVVVAPHDGAIRRIQAELAVRGFNPGPIDGILGPRTMTALRTYQRDQGLIEGLLTVETLSRLGIAVNRPVQPHRDLEAAPALSGGPSGPVQKTERASDAPVAEAEPVQVIPTRASLPNYVGIKGTSSTIEPLDWPGRTGN